MLNVVQLLVSLPLLNLNFPANAVYFYNLIGDLAQMNFVPSQATTEKVTQARLNWGSDNVPDNFQAMDIFETKPIET